MKKLNKVILKSIDVDPSDIIPKRELKHILGGYNGNESYSICCRKADDSGCDFSFYNNSCSDPYSLCLMYSGSGTYTCRSVKS